MRKPDKIANIKEENDSNNEKKTKHAIYKHSWLHRLIHRGNHYHIEGQ